MKKEIAPTQSGGVFTASEITRVNTPKTSRELSRILRKYKVDTSRWGSPGTKSVSDLFQEIRDGQSTLEVREGRLTRIVLTVGINVMTTFDTNRMRLIEKDRIFNTRSSLPRSIITSISELRRADDDPRERAIEIIQSICRVSITPHHLSSQGRHLNYRGSNSFCNLYNCVDERRFELSMDPKHARYQGYAHSRENQTTFYTWELPS